MNAVNKKNIIILLLICLSVLSLILIAINEETLQNKEGVTLTEIEQYFHDEITTRTLQQLNAQPIEGLDASMYMRAYPGLQASDFNAVQTLGDTNQGGIQTSADAVVTDQGLISLLENVGDRLNLDVDSPIDIDVLLATLSKDVHEENATEITEPAFQNALSYSCVMSGGNWLDAKWECEYTQAGWCNDAGGSFNECMSACRHGENVEICTAQCVPVCSFIDGR